MFIVAGLLLFLPVAGLLVGLGWLWESDRAGKQALADVFHQLAAAGEPTDFNALIPPSIPKQNNLGALSLFKTEYDPTLDAQRPLELEKALQNLGPGDSRRFGTFLRSERWDDSKLKRFLATRFQAAFPNEPLPSSPLAQCDALCPVLAVLRDAAGERKDCRFDRDYTSDPPFNRELVGVTSLIKLAQATNLHAVIALRAQAPDVALQDIGTTLTLDAGARKEPVLVSGLVAIGVFTIEEQSLWEGLEDHRWNDAHLAELQGWMASIDFLSDGQRCLRGEALGFAVPTLEYMREKTHARPLYADLAGEKGGTSRLSPFGLSPKGWFDAAEAEELSVDFYAARILDPKKHRAYPENFVAPTAPKRTLTSYEPPMLLARVAAGPLVDADIKFALAQCRADQAYIACMLERYRLAHRALPRSLNELTAFGPVPNDVCNGEPYHYSLRPDGTFLLYSVGWNLSDEDGTVALKKDNPSSSDETHGDWVWPQPGHRGT